MIEKPSEAAILVQQTRMAEAVARARCGGPARGGPVCPGCEAEGRHIAAYAMKCVLETIAGLPDIPDYPADHALRVAVNGWCAAADRTVAAHQQSRLS